jgi:hypothetical protein
MNKKNTALNSIMLLSIFLAIVSYAFITGTTGKTQLSGNQGCNCHGVSPTSTVNVVIEGPENLTPNQSAEYIVTISGGLLIAGGVNIAASAGTLTPGEGLRLENGELTHVSPKPQAAGMVTFNFTLTAPESGTTIIYATGNSVNNNGSATGDVWNFSQPKSVLVGPAVNVEDEIMIAEFTLQQNYPNPFNPSTLINYEIPVDASGEMVSLKVYDLLGTEIAELVNEIKPAGKYSINFNASNLSSGVYIYKITAGKYAAARKMSLVK